VCTSGIIFPRVFQDFVPHNNFILASSVHAQDALNFVHLMRYCAKVCVDIENLQDLWDPWAQGTIGRAGAHVKPTLCGTGQGTGQGEGSRDTIPSAWVGSPVPVPFYMSNGTSGAVVCTTLFPN
jgi:hypothetical protein